MKKSVRNAGFTLIEVIVVAAIIAILAGILVPMIFNQIDESKKTRALGDCKSIQSALLAFRKDVGSWPNKTAPATANVDLLYVTSTAPPVLPPDADLTGLGWGVAIKHPLHDHLRVDEYGSYGTLWKGPYMSDFSSDPWGNPYLISAGTFDDPAAATWVLSMGPDGILQTNIVAVTVMGDDIAVRIK